jgi:probable rRNA maturation factor
MVLNRQRRVRVPVASLDYFLATLLREFRLDGDSVTVCLAGDEEISHWNRIYRGKRGPTDVLSFPAQSNGARRNGTRKQIGARSKAVRRRAPSPTPGRYLGDIAISPRVARLNAQRFRRPLSMELRILILHGLLHLLGYDHESDHGEMARYERRLRSRFRLA